MARHIEFDDGQAASYRRIGETLVVISDCKIVFHKTWGEQTIQPGDRVMVPLDAAGQPMGEVYGCSAAAFLETYEPAGQALVHRKSALVRAYQIPSEFSVRTVVASGEVEVEANTRPAGSWVIRNPGGEVYTNDDDQFRAQYVRVDPEPPRR